MNKPFKKICIVFWLAAVNFMQQACAQDSCYNCNIDSLSLALRNTKTDDEKIKLLSLLIDLRLQRIDNNLVADSILTDDVSKSYLEELIGLSEQEKIEDIDGYKSLLSAFIFFEKKENLNGQNSLKKSIAFFDVVHKKIPYLLMFTRYAYNLEGNQEDRYQFYSDKLNYYITNGPIENAAPCYHGIGGYYLYKADYNLAISNYLKAASIFKNYDSRNYRNDLGVVAGTYADWGNYQKALEYYKKEIPLNKMANDSSQLNALYIGLARMNINLKKYDEALHFADTSLAINNNRIADFITIEYLQKAFALIGLNRLNEGFYNLNYAKKLADSLHTKIFSATGSFELDYGYFQYYSAVKKYDEAGKYLLLAYQKSTEVKSNELQLKYLKYLSLFYQQQHDPALAMDYTKKFYDLTDELNKEHSSFKVAQYENEEKEIAQNENINALKQERAIQAATIKKNYTILWGSLIALILISGSLFFVYRQYLQNKKILSSLKKTQRQLIMSEKMASLGELTAGIAHEIENPLNFVNNFSEVNMELIEELKSERLKITGERNEQLEDELLNDIAENELKINHHGKRADAIVKGMLQHSQSSSGKKELTNINALTHEYLKVTYHGLRAKDKTFNTTLQTDFDTSVGKINIIPQDIGRVLLNLFTNAFYAVTEKKKQSDAGLPARAGSNGNNSLGQASGKGYEPTVSVEIKRLNDKIELRVKDNGNGIPQKILDKIYQPFFTTKPAGHGTGLGLSISYDIIKAHDGEIKVETIEGKGTEFIIQLPIV